MKTGVVKSEPRSVYNVHVYREMRLYYPDIVATSQLRRRRFTGRRQTLRPRRPS